MYSNLQTCPHIYVRRCRRCILISDYVLAYAAVVAIFRPLSIFSRMSLPPHLVFSRASPRWRLLYMSTQAKMALATTGHGCYADGFCLLDRPRNRWCNVMPTTIISLPGFGAAAGSSPRHNRRCRGISVDRRHQTAIGTKFGEKMAH
jgi:hypothetical protein